MADEPKDAGGGPKTLEDVIAAVKELAPALAKVTELQNTVAALVQHEIAEGEDPVVDGEMSAPEMAAADAAIGKRKSRLVAMKTAGIASKALDEKIAGLDALAATLKTKKPTEKVDPLRQEMDALPGKLRAEAAAVSSLANRLSRHIGTFDHAAMTLDACAKYGAEKLGLKPAAGAELAMIEGYLAANPGHKPGAGMDSKDTPRSGLIDAHINGKPE